MTPEKFQMAKLLMMRLARLSNAIENFRGIFQRFLEENYLEDTFEDTVESTMREHLIQVRAKVQQQFDNL